MAIHLEHSSSGYGAFHIDPAELPDIGFPGSAVEPAPASLPAVPPTAAVEPEPTPSSWVQNLPASAFGPPAANPGEPVLLTLLANLPPPAAVAITEAPAVAATPAAPTAPAMEIAILELTLADPLTREFIQHHGGTLPVFGGAGLGAVLQTQIDRYGADLTARLTQLNQANAAVRHLYLEAMDQAAQNLGPGTMGAVFVPGGFSGGEGDFTPDTWRFDPVAFTQAYAQAGLQPDAPLTQRAFAATFGNNPLQAWEQYHGGDAEFTQRGHTLGGSFELTAPSLTDLDGHPNRERMGWTSASLNPGSHALRPLSLTAPPELHNPQAVWFDASLGWVTPSENVVVKQDFLDKAIPVVFVGLMTWATAGAFGIAGGAGVAAGAGIGAGGGIVGAMTAGAAFGAIGGFYGGLVGEGKIDLGGMFRGALTGAVTAGVVRAAGLNEMGVTRGLDAQGQSIVTGIDYVQRAMAVTGQAMLQGALQKISGGEFREGFTTGLAQGLGAEISRGLELKISELQSGNDPINATQAGALRQFARVAQSAVSLLANPDDPGHAFAMTFVNGLVGDVQQGLAARELQGIGPWSAGNYRNGSDIDSDNAYQARRDLEWTRQNDAILARRSDEGRVATPDPARASTVRTVTVVAGQTLSGLAGTNDAATLDRIAQFNGLPSRHEIVAGQQLALPDEQTLAGVEVSRAVAQRGEVMAERWAQAQAAGPSTATQGPVAHGSSPGAPLTAAGEQAQRLQPDAVTELRQILRYAQVRNSDLPDNVNPEFWAQRAQDLAVVAQRYKELTRPTDGQPWVADSTYQGLVADARVALSLSGVAIGRDGLDMATRLLIENGGVASAGVVAGALAGRSGRGPVTSEGTANASAGAALQSDLQRRAGVQPDTSRDAYYIAMNDPRIAADNRFDWDHVLAGEVNAAHKATGYHWEDAAGGAARINPLGTVKHNPNGTYEAPVQVWDSSRGWVDKSRESTFFPADWSLARVQFEVSEAFKLGQAQGLAGTRFQAISPSGIEIQFSWDAKNRRTTFYPLGK